MKGGARKKETVGVDAPNSRGKGAGRLKKPLHRLTTGGEQTQVWPPERLSEHIFGEVFHRIAKRVYPPCIRVSGIRERTPGLGVFEESGREQSVCALRESGAHVKMTPGPRPMIFESETTDISRKGGAYVRPVPSPPYHRKYNQLNRRTTWPSIIAEIERAPNPLRGSGQNV